MPLILIVEDDPSNRELLVQLLEEEYQVLQAADGEDAVAIAAAERPDLIVMDLALPGTDGWEATRRIKFNHGTGHIPVIALTGYALGSHHDEALRAGCDVFLTKPIDPGGLCEHIRDLLAGRS